MVHLDELVHLRILRTVEKHTNPSESHYVYVGSYGNKEVSVVSDKAGQKGMVPCVVSKVNDDGTLRQARTLTGRQQEQLDEWKRRKDADANNLRHSFHDFTGQDQAVVKLVPHWDEWGSMRKGGYGGFFRGGRFKIEPEYNSFLKNFCKPGEAIPAVKTFIYTNEYDDSRVIFFRPTDAFVNERAGKAYAEFINDQSKMLTLAESSLAKLDIEGVLSMLLSDCISSDLMHYSKDYAAGISNLNCQFISLKNRAVSLRALSGLEKTLYAGFEAGNPDIMREAGEYCTGPVPKSLGIFDLSVLQMLQKAVPEESANYVKGIIGFADKHATCNSYGFLWAGVDTEGIHGWVADNWNGLESLACSRQAAFGAYGRLFSDLYPVELMGAHFLLSGISRMQT